MSGELHHPEGDLGYLGRWSSPGIGLRPDLDYRTDPDWRDEPDEPLGCMKGIALAACLAFPFLVFIVGCGMFLFRT